MGHTAPVRSVCVTQEGKTVMSGTIVSGSDDNDICTWSLNHGVCVCARDSALAHSEGDRLLLGQVK